MRQGGSEYIPNGIPGYDVCADNHKSKGTPQHLTIFDYITYTVLLYKTTLPTLSYIYWTTHCLYYNKSPSHALMPAT